MASKLDEWEQHYEAALRALSGGKPFASRQEYDEAKSAAWDEANHNVPEVGRALTARQKEMGRMRHHGGQGIRPDDLRPATPDQHLAQNATQRAARVCRRLRLWTATPRPKQPPTRPAAPPEQLPLLLSPETTPHSTPTLTATRLYRQLSEEYDVLPPDKMLASITGLTARAFGRAREMAVMAGYDYQPSLPNGITGLRSRAHFWSVSKRPVQPSAAAKAAAREYGGSPVDWQKALDLLSPSVAGKRQED